MDRPLTKMTRMVIMIDTVDIARKTVHGIDKTGGKFQASYVVTAMGFQIPLPGENWTVIRHGNIWHLEARFDGPEETAKFDLSPGDVHLRTPANLYIDAGTFNMGSGLMSATTRDTTKITGTQGTYTLSSTPVHPYTVMVYKNGALLHPDVDWTISGAIITFTSNLVANDKLTAYYQRTGVGNLDSATVTAFADMSSSHDDPYKDADSVIAVGHESAWESR